MVSKETNIRAALEKLFAKPFSDYQWGLISSQGYEDAIASGARTVEDVAEELKGLVEAAGRRTAASVPDGAGQAWEGSLTWDQMERLVLGRILATGETSGPKATPGSPNSGVRLRRLSVFRRRSRRRLWIVLWSCLAALVVATVAVLGFFGPVWGLWGTSPLTTAATSSTTVAAGTRPDAPSTTVSTIMPPVTIPVLELPDYEAQLTGAQVVSAVETDATGTLELRLSDDGESVKYVLTVQNITGLTVAKLRTAKPGENGKEIVSLYPGPTKKGLFSGVVADWRFSADDFVGPLKGKTMADFIALLESGSVYVNVGSTGHRDGELRGQLQ